MSRRNQRRLLSRLWYSSILQNNGLGPFFIYILLALVIFIQSLGRRSNIFRQYYTI